MKMRTYVCSYCHKKWQDDEEECSYCGSLEKAESEESIKERKLERERMRSILDAKAEFYKHLTDVPTWADRSTEKSDDMSFTDWLMLAFIALLLMGLGIVVGITMF